MNLERIPDSLQKQLIIFDENGHPVIRVGLFLTLYFEDAYLETKRMAIFSCAQEFLKQSEGNIEWGLLGVGKPQPKDKFSTNAMQDYLSGLDVNAIDGWQVYWHSGTPIEASSFGFEAFGSSKTDCEKLKHLSYVTVHFPVTTPVETLENMALQWSEYLQPAYGYGGLGIIHAADDFIAAKHEIAEFGLAKRFPALEVDYPLKHTLWTREGIKGGNWLTILSEYWLQQLEISGNSIKLIDPFNITQYQGGVIIRAGEVPDIVDVNSGDDTPIYRDLAKILRSIRIKTHPAIHTSRGKFDKQTFEEWLARFDK